MLIFSEHPCQHPVVILPPDVRPQHLQHVLNFVYRGEVQVKLKKEFALFTTAPFESLSVRLLASLAKKVFNFVISLQCFAQVS